MSNIINLSGGKDSTAMLHWMLEKGEDIHSVVFFDTGWEFPEMYDHLDQIERNTGIEIIRLKPITTIVLGIVLIFISYTMVAGYYCPSSCTTQSLSCIMSCEMPVFMGFVVVMPVGVFLMVIGWQWKKHRF